MIYSIIIGGISGWLAGLIFKGKGFGILMNIVIGIVGGLIGGWTFGLLGIHAYGFLGRVIISVLGAGILFWLINFFNKRT
ncbi:MAG TPA: GlsB/YeaQ/YmgE family stress response membrane protein [Bacteroidetes bacterium]|nr:GlsB/YeaQ/YmgE family stress response membrane protein [Bacteroidota bacterium]